MFKILFKQYKDTSINIMIAFFGENIPFNIKKYRVNIKFSAFTVSRYTLLINQRSAEKVLLKQNMVT
ncbi:hypothetical protein TH53_14300 [Pedobacter lusitanus]|uniref:Contig60, whole genome shotgun sequence n=1 Tax=Pedobacter lusitanus TaxID=1503925 RepID=A0A0D0FVN8_9SPHI|nr:hypothetical protein TH53_14300 [Pedobacter lusitanus]